MQPRAPPPDAGAERAARVVDEVSVLPHRRVRRRPQHAAHVPRRRDDGNARVRITERESAPRALRGWIEGDVHSFEAIERQPAGEGGRRRLAAAHREQRARVDGAGRRVGAPLVRDHHLERLPRQLRLPFDVQPEGAPVEQQPRWGGTRPPHLAQRALARADLIKELGERSAAVDAPLSRDRLPPHSGGAPLEQRLQGGERGGRRQHHAAGKGEAVVVVRGGGGDGGGGRRRRGLVVEEESRELGERVVGGVGGGEEEECLDRMRSIEEVECRRREQSVDSEERPLLGQSLEHRRAAPRRARRRRGRRRRRVRGRRRRRRRRRTTAARRLRRGR